MDDARRKLMQGPTRGLGKNYILQQQLHSFWVFQMQKIEQAADFKNHQLPYISETCTNRDIMFNKRQARRLNAVRLKETISSSSQVMGIASAEKPLIKRRLWNMVTVGVFLTRKCMLKRKYLQEGFTNWGKLLANNVRNIMSRSGSSGPFGLREYEFSCSNSPAFTKQRHEHNYFSRIRPTSFGDEEERDMRVDILQPCNFPAIEDSETQTCDLGDGEELGTPMSRSIEVRVDREAEDFIARFHSQIKYQRQISLLQYEEMLARGA